MKVTRKPAITEEAPETTKTLVFYAPYGSGLPSKKGHCAPLALLTSMEIDSKVVPFIVQPGCQVFESPVNEIPWYQGVLDLWVEQFDLLVIPDYQEDKPLATALSTANAREIIRGSLVPEDIERFMDGCKDSKLKAEAKKRTDQILQLYNEK